MASVPPDDQFAKPRKHRRGHGEGSVYPFKRDASGKVIRWAASIELGWEGGKRRRRVVTAKTRREVLEKCAALRRAQEAGQTIAPDRQTVGQYLDEWLETVVEPSREDRTVVGYQAIVRNHLKPELGQIRLVDLRPEDVERLYARKRQAGLSAGTIHNIHIVLHSALARAVKYRRLAHNPADIMNKPTRGQFKASVLTAEQAEQLLSSARDHRLYALLVLVLTTGIREGEVFGLRWIDVDLDAGRASIVQTADRRRRSDPIGTPKSYRSSRPVPIIPLAAEALRAHRKRQAEERLLAGPAWQENGLVFTTRRGTPIDSSNFNRRDWRGIMLNAQLTKPDPDDPSRLVPLVRFHDLRHSAATFLLRKKVPLKVVSELLGHSSIGITADIYSHVVESMIDSAATAMAELFKAPKSGHDAIG